MKIRAAKRPKTPDQSKRRLLFWLVMFFWVLALPIYLLLNKAYSQLENESWYNQRSQAEILIKRIDKQLLDKLQPEQNRPIAEYSFFNVLENTLLQSATVNFSPLSSVPPQSEIPGLIGYFQIDTDGSFHIPALPEIEQDAKTGLSENELTKRLALKTKLKSLLVADDPPNKNMVNVDKDLELRDQLDPTLSNEPLTDETDNFQSEVARKFNPDIKKKSEIPTAQESNRQMQGFADQQQLSLEQLNRLNIETSLWDKRTALNEALSKDESKGKVLFDYRSKARKEVVKLPDQSSAGNIFKQNRQIQEIVGSIVAEEESADKPDQIQEKKDQAPKAATPLPTGEKTPPIRFVSFETEVSPLQLTSLKHNHWCFYRNVWTGRTRYIQGFVVNQSFLQNIIAPILNDQEFNAINSLVLAHNGQILQQFQVNPSVNSLLLLRQALTVPLQDIEIIVAGTGTGNESGRFGLNLISFALSLILITGMVLFYRLGAGQIELAKQQGNFISSVSHELKTPLTSIRMYAEMLRSDWLIDEERKKSYYDFIFFESERLSRLINNVLRLARLDNHSGRMKLTPISANKLLQQIHHKIEAQFQNSDFKLNLIPPASDLQALKINCDEDAFFQIMINLVDNAIKFSRQAEKRTIDIGYLTQNKHKQLIFFVRDYGPGIDNKQRKKIFQLFYRAGNEMTRTQPGTGIGLALVTQLAQQMNATVDMINRSPGAEFQIKFNTA